MGTQNRIEKILSQLNSPIVFDIGANISNHALVMARQSKQVYLFEPQVSIVKLLQETMALNHINNWKIFAFGLSDENKTLALYKNLDGNNGASTFIPELKGQDFTAEELQVFVGDDIVKQQAIERLDFIKIDVEGFEAKVIAGLKNSIKKFRPIIIIEWNNEITKKQFQEYNLFKEVFDGYLIKTIINSHHKSLWSQNWLGKIYRFFAKNLTKKRWVIGKFTESLDYQHVLLIPREKADILNSF